MLALHYSGKKGMNTIHLFDQSIVYEERAECGLYSKSFPMSGSNAKFQEMGPFSLKIDVKP